MENRDQWLENRRKGIGGSDIAAVIGMSKWDTPLSIYRAKVLGEKKTETEAMRRGHDLEPIVAKRFAEDYDFNVIVPEQEIYEHPENPIFKASIDRFYADKETGEILGVLECKTTTYNVTHDTIPEHWICQCQWYLGVTGLQTAALCWMGARFEHDMIFLERDDDFIKAMQDKAQEFWDSYIETGIEPEPSTPDEVKQAYRSVQQGKVVVAVPEVADLVRQAKQLADQAKEYEAAAESLKAKIKLIMRDAETMQFGDEVICTYKKAKNSEKFDVKAFEAAEPEMYAEYLKEVEGARSLLIKI